MSFPSPVETAMLTFINDERRMNGLEPLTFGSKTEKRKPDPNFVVNIFAPLGPMENMLLRRAAHGHGATPADDLLAELEPVEDAAGQPVYNNFTKPFVTPLPQYAIPMSVAQRRSPELTAASA